MNDSITPFWKAPDGETIINAGLYRGTIVIVTDRGVYAATDSPGTTALDQHEIVLLARG